MIHKPGKSSDDVKSYRPISLLPITFKVVKMLFLKEITIVAESKIVIPDHQFAFRKQHGTVEQVLRVVDRVNTAIVEKSTAKAFLLTLHNLLMKYGNMGCCKKLKKRFHLPSSIFYILT